MKKRIALFVLLALSFSVIWSACAGDGAYYKIITRVVSGQNSKNIKMQIAHNEDFSGCDRGHRYQIRLQQKDFPRIVIAPDGNISVPITLSLRMEVMSMSEDIWYPYVAKIRIDNQMPNYETEGNILFLPLNLMTFASEKHDIELPTPRRVHMQYDIFYDANGYEIVNDLRITFPTREGVTLNEKASKEGHYVIEAKKGLTIPNDNEWQFFLGDKKVHLSTKDGWVSYGKHSGYLPPKEEVIAENPVLSNRCVVVFSCRESRTKTLHYAIVEGIWVD